MKYYKFKVFGVKIGVIRDAKFNFDRIFALSLFGGRSEGQNVKFLKYIMFGAKIVAIQDTTFNFDKMLA